MAREHQVLFAQRELCNKEVHKIMSKVHLYPPQITFQLPRVCIMKKAMFHHLRPSSLPFSVLSCLFVPWRGNRLQSCEQKSPGDR